MSTEAKQSKTQEGKNVNKALHERLMDSISMFEC